MDGLANAPPRTGPAEPLLPAPGSGQIHLWVLDARSLSDAKLAPYLTLLSPEEVAQNQRYLLPRARREHLAARTLLRRCLSRYAEVAPQRWQFARQDQGKPIIAAPALELPLHFNLSHSRGLLICAVASRPELGVDVEHTARVRDLDRVARAVLAPSELAQLTTLPPAEKRQRFFILWTLKEAYLKARGLGLRLPLRQIAFAPASTGTFCACFGPQVDDDPERWWFAPFLPTESFQAAAAFAQPAGSSPALVMRTLAF